MLSNPDLGWCDVARAYYERYVVGNNIEGVEATYSYIVNDELFEARMRELCTEFGDKYDNRKTKKVTLEVVDELLKRPINILETPRNFEAVDEYKVFLGNTLFVKGNLNKVNETTLVHYDETKWWFAKGADGTILNNAQEVENYLGSIVRERKYIHADDNTIQWKPA